MKRMTVTALVLLVGWLLPGARGGAQAGNEVRPAVIPFVGAYVPRGSMAREFTTSTVLGLCSTIELFDFADAMASASWIAGHNRLVRQGTDATNIWQYDAGVEAVSRQQWSPEWSLSPFAGIGAGARTYDHRARGIATTTNAIAYGSLGLEAQRFTLVYRLESRAYVSRFNSPVTGQRQTRADFVVSIGATYRPW